MKKQPPEYHLQEARLALGQVRHQRLLPKPNGFASKTCFVRLVFTCKPEAPRWADRWPAIDKRGLFAVYGKSYGFEPHTRTLAQQATHMQKTVAQQTGIELAGDIHLQTYPKVLGYAFNPVSFWYFHNLVGECRAIVCEVNNTFGERHFYLLTGSAGQTLNRGSLLVADKQFHVSPFSR
ncbi:MAG: DUF1365 domain-containing protein [Limnobacter sp.]|nr:DUF1365 domain-containing protein [Limnobacter sp.]